MSHSGLTDFSLLTLHTKKNRMKLTYTSLMVLLVLLTSCPESTQNPSCETCKDALQQMQVKLEAAQCEPLVLEDELNLIEAQCITFNSSVLVGYLAETCHKGSTELPQSCEDPVLELLILSFAKLGNLPDEIDVEMEYGNPLLSVRFPLEGFYLTKDFQGRFTQGMSILFTVLKKNTKEELVRGTATFRFDRPDKYSYTREVVISYDAENSAYLLTFNDW